VLVNLSKGFASDKKLKCLIIWVHGEWPPPLRESLISGFEAKNGVVEEVLAWVVRVLDKGRIAFLRAPNPIFVLPEISMNWRVLVEGWCSYSEVKSDMGYESEWPTKGKPTSCFGLSDGLDLFCKHFGPKKRIFCIEIYYFLTLPFIFLFFILFSLILLNN
jgi:hypothetical protein